MSKGDFMEYKDSNETIALKVTAALPPAQARLRQISTEVIEAAECAGRELEQSFDAMAVEALDKEKDKRLDQEIQGKIDAFKNINNDLKQAYLKTLSMEDELVARFRDMRKSRDRKWYLPNPPANGTIDLEEQQKGHFAQGVNLYKLLLICFVGSFVGVVIESLWCLLQHGYLESRSGLVYGPFTPLYGVGAVVLSCVLYQYRNRSPWLSFLTGAIVGSIVEYFCSWLQETVFHSHSWDYSDMPFNINGRICLLYSCFWGILGVWWIKDLYPRMAKWILKLPNKAGKAATWCVTVFLVFDCAVSLISVLRWSERVRNIPPANSFWELVDERFPDERMERIYANMEFSIDDNQS